MYFYIFHYLINYLHTLQNYMNVTWREWGLWSYITVASTNQSSAHVVQIFAVGVVIQTRSV